VAAVASHNYGVLAADHGLALHEPLLDPQFVRSWARAAGAWGHSSRTEAMRVLFADLLPEAVISRRSKAYFNRAFMGEATRDFAERWDGGGLDPELVDVEVLREEWLSDFPSAISTPLLHAAWLSTTPAHQGGAR
jgi:asparagine synthase (glutamine-hydrolysing)